LFVWKSKLLLAQHSRACILSIFALVLMYLGNISLMLLLDHTGNQ
jgi:hypothetical protein